MMVDKRFYNGDWKRRKAAARADGVGGWGSMMGKNRLKQWMVRINLMHEYDVPLKGGRPRRNCCRMLCVEVETYALLLSIIPGQLGDKQSPSYIVPGLRMHKILRVTNFYAFPLFYRYVE